jgi:hypothetical protein
LELNAQRRILLLPFFLQFEVSNFMISCYEMDTSGLAGRSFLFLDEKKRTKEKSKQNNAPTHNPNAHPAVSLGLLA